MIPAALLLSISFTFFPNYGSLAGGDTVRLTVQPAIAGVPDVLFDGIPATDVTVVDSHTLTVVTPPHAEGAVEIQLRMNGETAASFPYFGYLRPRETTLIPVAIETPGGYGSRWTTDIWVFNDSNETVTLTPNYCFSLGAYFPCSSDLVVAAHSALKVPPRGFPEMYLSPPSDVRDKLHFSVRVRDASHDDMGTEIPIVPLTSYRDRRTVLVNVPVRNGARSVLRVYDFTNPIDVQVFDEITGDLLTKRFSGLRFTAPDTSALSSFTFFDLLGDPAVHGHDRVRIEIDETNPGPIPSPLQLWAMLTETDNITQRVTVFTSQ